MNDRCDGRSTRFHRCDPSCMASAVAFHSRLRGMDASWFGSNLAFDHVPRFICCRGCAFRFFPPMGWMCSIHPSVVRPFLSTKSTGSVTFLDHHLGSTRSCSSIYVDHVYALHARRSTPSRLVYHACVPIGLFGRNAPCHSTSVRHHHLTQRRRDTRARWKKGQARWRWTTDGRCLARCTTHSCRINKQVCDGCMPCTCKVRAAASSATPWAWERPCKWPRGITRGDDTSME